MTTLDWEKLNKAEQREAIKALAKIADHLEKDKAERQKRKRKPK